MLKVKNLTTYCYNSKEGIFGKLIENLSFEINKGEVVAITGESGCGKTVTATSVMGLIDFMPGIISGEVCLEKKNGEKVELLEGLDGVWNLENIEKGIIEEKKKNAFINWKRNNSSFMKNNIYGKEISFIFQDSRSHMNPYISIGKQMEEVITLHRKDVKNPKKEVVEWLKNRVGLLDNIRMHKSPEKKAYKAYRELLSGGMCQKAMIGMALASHPSLIIADEPTTGLDCFSQQEVIKLMEESRVFCQNPDLSMIVVTHDLDLIKKTANRVMVMYGGQIVEEGTVNEVFSKNTDNHPYTQMLKKCLTESKALTLEGNKKLSTISGEVYDPFIEQKGCRFGNRGACASKDDKCKEFGRPEAFISVSKTHKIKCKLAECYDPERCNYE